MIHFRRILSSILVICITITYAWGQNGINSPLTRYGFGQLADQNLGGNKAMGGIGIGLRNGLQINASNPASYTAVDTLTFLFETGISVQNANFSDGTTKLNVKNSSFDYLAMQFRLFRDMGMTIGFLPYSNVGYSFSSTQDIPAQSIWDDPTTVTRSYTGNGGLHQVFMGVGYKLFPNLSVGTNLSYLFGNFSHKITANFSDATQFPLARTYYAEISDIKLDFGAQYTMRFASKDQMTFGATYSLGKDLHAIKSYISNQKLNSSSVISDSVQHINNAFQLPHAFGIGATYVHDNRLTIGADFLLQKFSNTRFFGKEGDLADRMKCAIGVQFYPDPMSNKLIKQIKYSAGAYYSKPYVKVNGKEAAHEYGIGAGMSIPISTKWGWMTQHSIINISGEWVKIDPKINGVLTENYLRLSVGLTFNERWFMKQKIR